MLDQQYSPQFDIIFDDDDAHECADVVAIKVDGERINVFLFHCKYSQKDDPGARLDDLYEVCGQAQRSIYWKGDVVGMLQHLRNREESRLQRCGVSRFERGDDTILDQITRQCHYLQPEFTIFIVQPGLSKVRVTDGQLNLIAATELYLQETYAIPLKVITSQ